MLLVKVINLYMPAARARAGAPGAGGRPRVRVLLRRELDTGCDTATGRARGGHSECSLRGTAALRELRCHCVWCV